MKSVLGASSLGALTRPRVIRPSKRLLLPSSTRCLHQTAQYQRPAAAEPIIPQPTPFVPDVATFLKVIGRGLSQHASKFPTWEALFSLTSPQLVELGIEPPRTRRYLIQWRKRFAERRFGLGGDIKHIKDGVAELQIAKRDVTPTVIKHFVVNVPAGKKVHQLSSEDMVRIRDFNVKEASTIVGPHVVPKKGGGALLKITEGIWEDVRGHKVDGGERRKTEVRFKKRIAARKADRERQMRQ